MLVFVFKTSDLYDVLSQNTLEITNNTLFSDVEFN